MESGQQYGVYILDNYLITYDLKFGTETFECDSYYGIIFHLENGDSYELLHNYHMGDRLLVKTNGTWQDIPFKPSSFGCLPDGINTIVIAGD
jgi:hypothetical protein